MEMSLLMQARCAWSLHPSPRIRLASSVLHLLQACSIGDAALPPSGLRMDIGSMAARAPRRPGCFAGFDRHSLTACKQGPCGPICTSTVLRSKDTIEPHGRTSTEHRRPEKRMCTRSPHHNDARVEPVDSRPSWGQGTLAWLCNRGYSTLVL